ncbi:MAG TPA: MBL fold metallo-hydrolase [Clostridiales bacterium]|nr:MBL fold metallo-hydrolase [Clostridiales bacterium]
MIIEWLGHSCFKLVSDTGHTFLFDPYDPSYTGLEHEKIDADVVLMSHGHGDHGAIHQVKNYKKVIKSAGTYEYEDVKIKAIKSFHDPKNGALRGENLIFVLSIGSLNICHFGDIGQNLTEKQINEIGNVDIILIPIGGIYTIDALQAKEFINILNPKVTIPMHFKIKNLKFDLNYLSDFLDLFEEKDIEIVNGDSVKITKNNLENMPKVLVFGFNRAIKK